LHLDSVTKEDEMIEIAIGGCLALLLVFALVCRGKSGEDRTQAELNDEEAAALKEQTRAR
jgi:hypothetical protein